MQFRTSPWAWVMLCHHPSLSHSVLQVHQMTYTQSCLSHCNFISATLAALDYPFPEQYHTFYCLQIVSAWRQSMLFDLWTSDHSPLQPSLQSSQDPTRGEGHVMLCWIVYVSLSLSHSLVCVSLSFSLFTCLSSYFLPSHVCVCSIWTAAEADGKLTGLSNKYS